MDNPAPAGTRKAARTNGGGYAPAAAEPPWRPPPHNFEAEQALLGAILYNNEVLDRVSDFLAAHHFFDPLHQQIYETAAKLIADGKQATPVTLKTYFEGAEPIDATLSVPQYLGRIAAGAVATINGRDYGRTIYDLATRRQIILIGEDMVSVAYDTPVDFDPAAQIDEASTRLTSLGETHPDRIAANSGLRCLDDIKPRDASPDIWRDVFGPDEVGTLFAVSQGGKGFLLTELCKRVSLGQPMFGRPTRASAVLQVQYEGARGLDRRVWAAAADLSPEQRALFNNRYMWRPDPVTLGRGRAGDRGEAAIIRDARSLEKRTGMSVGLITIDTAAKAIAGESLSDDDAVGLLHARCRRIASATGAAVLIVMHPGHGNQRRPAGSYQLIGSPDFVIRIDVGAPDGAIAIPPTARRTVIGEKIKEGVSGVTLGAFSLHVVEVWTRDDGQPVTSCIVVEPTEASRPAAQSPRSRKLTANQQTMLSILHEAGPLGLSIEEWNERARKQGIGATRKATLYDCKVSLLAHGLICEGAHGWFARRDVSG